MNTFKSGTHTLNNLLSNYSLITFETKKRNMKIIDGKKIASDIRNELKEKIQKLKEEGKNVPGLVTFLIGENPASQVYVKNKIKDCEEIGMRTKAENHPADISEAKLLEMIQKYNNDSNYQIGRAHV